MSAADSNDVCKNRGKGPSLQKKGHRGVKFKEKDIESFTQMDFTTFQAYRSEISATFKRAGGALFNTIDALIAETEAKSFPALTQSPFFERRWHSLYEAFHDGRIDIQSLQKIFIKYMPMPSPGKRLILGFDVTNIERPFSETSPDRTAIPMQNIPHTSSKKATAITYGWKYATAVVLPEKASSQTYVLDQRRVPSEKTELQVTCQQMKQIVPLLPMRPLSLYDRGYDCTWFWCECSRLPMDTLIRLKSNRTFYQPAPPHSGKRGAPRKDGDKLKLSDATTHQQPDGMWSGDDVKSHPVQISWWENMHVRNARWLNLTVIKVVRPRASNNKRDPRVSWFVSIGQDVNDGISQLALSYGLRFGQEHGYRFAKQALLWTLPRLRQPEQFELWSQIVAIVHNLIVLARDLVVAELYPWENKQREPSQQQLRRGLGKILPQLGTPAPAPRVRGKSPGRPHGAMVRKSPRSPIVCKTVKKLQPVPT
jgi:hypothetical protein